MRISDWSSDVCSSDLSDNKRCSIHKQNIGRTPPFWLAKNARALSRRVSFVAPSPKLPSRPSDGTLRATFSIGSASCRERVCQYVEISLVSVSVQQEKTKSREG